MKLTQNSRVYLFGFGLVLAYIPMLFIFSPLQLYLLTGSILMTSSVACVAAYWTVIGASVKLRIRQLDRTDILTFGILLLFAGTAFREGYVTFWREFFPLSDFRPGLYFQPLSFIRYTCIVASMMALSARKSIIGPVYMTRVPGWPHMFISLTLGIMVGFGMIYWRA